MFRYGKTSQGKQRWKCSDCGSSFVGRSVDYRRLRQRVWFERWISEGYSVRQLSQQSGYSASTIRRILTHWLSKSPPESTVFSGCRYLVIDGTYLQSRECSLVVFMDVERGEVLHGAYDVAEESRSMLELCRLLFARGLSPEVITLDGNRQLAAHLRAVWPSAKHQRCLVHVQRQGLSWCRRNPSRRDAQRLRRLFPLITRIETVTDRDNFLAKWLDWEQRYGQRIARQPERGWVFSDLKRARSMLARALPEMFTYLEYPGIARTTNAVEGYFGRMKQHYRQHRGLAKSNRKNYFSWYFHLKKR